VTKCFIKKQIPCITFWKIAYYSRETPRARCPVKNYLHNRRGYSSSKGLGTGFARDRTIDFEVFVDGSRDKCVTTLFYGFDLRNPQAVNQRKMYRRFLARRRLNSARLGENAFKNCRDEICRRKLESKT